MAEQGRSIFSQLYHLFAYSIRKSTPMRLERGMFIISVDVDAGSRELGVINRGKNDANVNNYVSECRIGEIEENALPKLAKVFEDFEIPVTFAIRGQLTEVNGSVLGILCKSAVKHDIGTHGYYHKDFANLSHGDAENELSMASAGLKKFGIVPKSFVFPRNSVAHLNLLERHGYKCYRGYGNFIKDSMLIDKKGALYNIHPSLYLDGGTRLVCLRRILNISIAKKLPLHVWFHPWSFGETEDSLQRFITKVFTPFFSYAKRKENDNTLSFETMLSAALKVENIKTSAVSRGLSKNETT
jgi:peptidoglycan/xylan/chitin deacetylase (PgdA/CDA1 family)